MKIQTQSSSWNQELTEDQYFRATKTPFETQNMLMTGKSKTLAGIPTNKRSSRAVMLHGQRL